MSNRTIYRINLRPVIGSRFQPTGFPDLGAAVFRRAGADGSGGNALLVESAQSMANWAERTTWDDATDDQVADLAGVPYVRVLDDDGGFLTSSRLEAHRLASAYVMDGRVDGTTGEQWLGERFGLVKGRPLDHRLIARVICALDPLSLVHGVFFARGRWPWQPKIARAVTSFIEAYDVEAAVSGGVKKDSVNSEGGHTDTGYGMVPHQRTEYTARSIVAFWAVDHAQLRSYGLGEAGEALLEAIIGYETARLFAGGLRLRTACDLEISDVDGPELPTVDGARDRLRSAVAAAGELLGPVAEVSWSARSVKAK